MISIQKLIDESIQEWSDTKSAARDNTKFSVSDAGLCYRARYYKRLGIEPTRVTPVGALRKMMAGEAAHEKLQAVLFATGHLESSEGPLALWGEVLGHYDAIVGSGDELVLNEYKTIEKWGMTHIKRDGPKNPHILQMFTYWYALRTLGFYPDLGQATLAYIMREDFSQIQFDYLWGDEVVKRVEAEWHPLLLLWKQQVLPDCTCPLDYGGNGISYCRYQSSPEECCSENLNKARSDVQI
jgi:hypothetical protein